MLSSASIPSMCGFPAGKLVDGKLMAKHPHYPNASAPAVADMDLVVAGDLTGDGVKELAAAFYCDKGGVAWPAHIQLFKNTAQGITALGEPFQMGSVNGGARGIPSSLKFKDAELVVDDRELLPNEPAAAPTGKIRAALAFNGDRLTVTTLADPANKQKGILQTATVNGTWCPGDKATKQHSADCLKIHYPQLTRANNEPETVSYWVNNNIVVLSYFDAPLGAFYAPGVKIQDPTNPDLPKGFLDQSRMYNSQTREFYVRKN